MTNEELYRDSFEGSSASGKKEKALENALDIRKFEIGLYWHRAAYFWALIAAAFAGYFAILSAEHLFDKEYLAYILACIGLIFTWAWYLVNRGSKFWQENWENHVDMLEDDVTGPLYKTVLHRPRNPGIFEKAVTGPLSISVSKVNQWVSAFVICIWIALMIHSMPKLNIFCPPNARYITVGAVTLVFGLLMAFGAQTHKGSYEHVMNRRQTRIL